MQLIDGQIEIGRCEQLGDSTRTATVQVNTPAMSELQRNEKHS